MRWADSATKRREAADFDTPAPEGAGTSPSGSRTARRNFRVETLIRLRNPRPALPHVDSKRSAKSLASSLGALDPFVTGWRSAYVRTRRGHPITVRINSPCGVAVAPGTIERPKASAGSLDLVQRVREIPYGARQAVQPNNDQRIAGALYQDQYFAVIGPPKR